MMPSALKRLLAALLAASLVLVVPVQASDWASVAEKVRPSIGFVGMFDENEMPLGSCTAFSINDAKDYFLTDYHCLAPVMQVDGHEATPIYQNPEADLMVLVVPDSGSYPALKLASDVAPGEAIGSYGWGLGLEFPTFRGGSVATANEKIPQIAANLDYGTPDEMYTLIDEAPVHGMSGGPIFNDQGEVVSIAQLIIPDNLGAGRSIEELSVKVGKYFTSDK